ncbi:hypothetical protein ABZ851_30475 [Streptomyces sp. NPDC047049]|uniref:hypothetical protein n=1 Tax=Streptomyces sp. NPDC047049 TaxID=3156688 RepID=UPI0033F16AF7
MPDHARDQNPSTPEPTDTSPARTAEQWRELLRNQELPESLAELPLLRRRRARKAWKSARRDARAEWVKRERRNVPTPVTVPIIALLLAGLVAAGSWLWPEEDHDPAPAKPHSTPTAAPAPPAADTDPAPTPTSSATSKRPVSPDGIAKSFVTAYSTRSPEREDSHVAAVDRAAPYASRALVSNLGRHEDRDWNKLIATQALTATPSKVTISAPSATQQLPPDTSVRIYRQATVRLDVKGTDDYSYTRHLTVEVSRADVGQQWQVTRVLGIQE